MTEQSNNYTMGLLGLFLTVFILFVGKSILMPFLIAFIISYLIISLMNYYKRRFKIPRLIAFIFAIISMIVILALCGFIINNSIYQVIEAIPRYQERFIEIIKQVYDLVGADSSTFADDFLQKLDLAQILKEFAQMVTSLMSKSALILIYTIFLLIEYKGYRPKLKAFCKEKNLVKQVDKVLDEISSDVGTYVRMKTLISVMTGGLSYVVLKVIGVDFPEFWAFIIFLFNYIPVVGSLVAISFPIMLSFVQFPGFLMGGIVTVSLLAIQFIMSNLVEPPLMGSSLNLSPIVIILSLALWGSIWGIIGMILCVPITVIVNIVLSKFPKTRSISILLSANGSIDSK